MGEEAIKRVLRRKKDSALAMHNDESFNASAARGKQAETIDITCYDKGGFKLVKVCLDVISQKELDVLLNYNECPLASNIIIQIDFWKKNGKKPFHREKLFYNQPHQRISDKLQNLVK